MDLKQVFLQELQKVWKGNTKMIDYCSKKCDYIVELDDGDIMEIEKPSINTHFCFGYGLNGVTTQDDMKRAFNCEEVARRNGDYFKEKNLESLNSWISALEGDEKIYKFISYYGLTEEDHLKSVRVFAYYERIPSNAIEISERERKAILEGYKDVKARFEKRLNTYLKRYGTSKLKTWTYLVD